MPMPDRFDEVWMLNNEDGTFTEVYRHKVSVYNQSYKGRGNEAADGGGCFAYAVKNRDNQRIVYCLRNSHEKAKDTMRAKCKVQWDDGEIAPFYCELAKVKIGKRCENDDGDGFMFLSRKTISVFEDNKRLSSSGSGNGNGNYTCKI